MKISKVNSTALSSKYSSGNITKDNLCSIFKIEGIETTHNGINDCKLEWQLFKKMDGYFYLITEGPRADNVFRLNDNYIIPVSLLISHPNLSRILYDRPYIECQSTIIKSFEISARGIEKFPTNFTGMTIEHLINSMLNVDVQDSYPFLLKNKKKLDFIGKIPNSVSMVPMFFNPDGTVTALQQQDKEMEKRINSTIKNLKEQIRPLIDFIKFEIFRNEHILSQELVVDSAHNILALCDLSTSKTVLEIKTDNSDSLAYKEQFFSEAKGREIYHLKMEWVKDWNTNVLKKVIFHISFVNVHIGVPNSSNWAEGKREEKRLKIKNEIQKYLSSSDLSLISFVNTSSPVILQCKKCKHEWTIRYATLIKSFPHCPNCKPKITVKKRTNLSKENKIKLRADKYYEKILQKSNQTIIASNYVGSKDAVDATCIICGHKWKSRADHLANRCWCPICKKQKKTLLYKEPNSLNP